MNKYLLAILAVLFWAVTAVAGVVSVEKIDVWDGNVIAGDPVDGDLVRLTYSNGTIREKIYWDIEIPEPPVVDQETALRRQLRDLINANTPAVIAKFVYNSNTYNLTEDVIQQVRDLAGILRTADDPGVYFPIDIVVSDSDGYDVVQTVNTIAGFKSAYLAIMEHIKTKRDEARTLKNSLDALNLAELQAWIDPRV